MVALLCKSFKLLYLHAPLSSSLLFLPSSLSYSYPFVIFSQLSFLRFLRTSPDHASSLPLKLHLLHQENFLPSHVQLLQNHPCFLAASFDRVASLVSFLRAKGLTAAEASKLFTRSPGLLGLRVECMETKCKFLQDFGVQSHELQKLLMDVNARRVLGTAVKTFQKRIAFLQRIGLNKEEVLRIIRKYPRVICAGSDRKAKATVAFFERHGLSKDDFAKLVRFHPQVFCHSIDLYLTEKLEFLKGLGLSFRSRSGLRALIQWVSVSRERLSFGWGILKDAGFPDSDIHRMVMRQPGLLLIQENSIKRRLDYLKSVLNRDLQAVVRFPSYLCYSFENRIIPRFTFLKERREDAKFKKILSLSYVLAPSDSVFERTHGSEYIKWKARYQKKQAIEGHA